MADRRTRRGSALALSLVLSACSHAATVPPPAPANHAGPSVAPVTDAAFQEAVLAIAHEHEHVIQAWGAIEYEHVPGRYAYLRPREGSRNTDGGIYLMETTGQYFLLSVPLAISNTSPPDKQPPPWSDKPIDALGYEGTFSDAHVESSFSIFHDKVVLLSFHDHSRKLDPAHPSPDDEKDEVFGCPACPPITGPGSPEGGIGAFASEVRGPSATLDALLADPVR